MKRNEHWPWECVTYKPEKSVLVFERDDDRSVEMPGMILIYMVVSAECILSGESAQNSLLLPARIQYREVLADAQNPPGRDRLESATY